MSYTPTPWVWLGHPNYEMAGAGGENVFWAPIGTYQGDGNIDHNADLIVKAVNAHDDLVAALKECRSALQTASEEDADFVDGAIRRANAALAKAEVQS